MAKFHLTKTLSLDFLGGAWKEKGAYLEFNSFTIRDLKESFPGIADVDSKDPKSVSNSLGETIKMLEQKFVSGKGIDADGNLVEVNKEDLSDLPAEVIGKLVGFLSQTLSEATSEKPSETP